MRLWHRIRRTIGEKSEIARGRRAQVGEGPTISPSFKN